MKSIKNIATIALTTIALMTSSSKADIFDGARPPEQYNVQLDARYDGKNKVLIPKLFGKRVYGFAATNFNAEKIRPHLGFGAITKTLDNKLHMLPTLEYNTATEKFAFTNYATLVLGKGKVNLDNVTTVNAEGDMNSSFSGSIDIYKGLRVGGVANLDGSNSALRLWYNPKNVKYILGASIGKEQIGLNLRVHF